MTTIRKLFTLDGGGWGGVYVDDDDNGLMTVAQYHHKIWSSSIDGWSTLKAKQYANLSQEEVRIRNLLIQHRVRSRTINCSDPHFAPGEYFHRVWRQRLLFLAQSTRDFYGADYLNPYLSICSLLDQVKQLFRYVEPAKANLEVYGHRIRELLILICTEVEAQWKAVLLSLHKKKYTGKDRLSTNDYFDIKDKLKLDHYELALRDYTGVQTFCPFKNWSNATGTGTTQSIGWYADYNATKHDSVNNINKATLKNLLAASAALHIMFAAQFGDKSYDDAVDELPPVFRIDKRPTWGPDELYLPPRLNKGEKWNAVEWQ